VRSAPHNTPVEPSLNQPPPQPPQVQLSNRLDNQTCAQPAAEHDMDNPQAIETTLAHAEVLQTLRDLTRDHLFFFRVEVGRVLLDRFFAGQPAAYLDRNPHKTVSFLQFVQAQGDALAELGLGEQSLRNCILTSIVVATLPPGVAEPLGLTKVVELTRLSDPTARARLAQAAVTQGWSVAELKAQVARAKRVHVQDVDPETPGLQLPPLPEPEQRAPAAGRVAQRLESWSRQATELTEALSGLDANRLTADQRGRLTDAVAAAEAQLAALRRALGTAP